MNTDKGFPSLRVFRFLFCFFFVIGFSLIVHSPVDAATRYVNADSDGSANNPTRPFDDPEYTANNSYKTFTAAFDAATNGDTIEFSGGIDGKSYAGHNASISKQLTIQGSSIAGFDGAVTITNNNSSYTLGANADNIVIQNLTISGSGSYVPLAIYKDNTLVKNVYIVNAGGNNYSISLRTGSSHTTNFINVVLYGNPNARGIEFISANAGTANFYNCVVNGVANVAVSVHSGDVANFTNCSFTANGTLTGNVFHYNDGGTINTTNCLVQGRWDTPQTVTSGTGAKTWISTSDILNAFPHYKSTRTNLGYLAFSTDDRENLNYCVTNANYAMTNYNIPISCYISDTHRLNEADKTKLQNLYRNGHEVGVHTRHHNDLSLSNAISVTYIGFHDDITFVVSNNGTRLSVTGSGDTHTSIDLTNISYDTIGKLCTIIEDNWPNYMCSVVTNISPYTPSITLKDASTSLPIGTPIGIPFDDSTEATNRYYTEEITNSIADLEAALHEDPACSAYTVKTLAFPFNKANSAVLNWIQEHTNLIGARSNDTVGTPLQKIWLGSIDVFNIYGRPTVSTFIGDRSKGAIEQGARVLASIASNGYFYGLLSHSTDEMTHQEWAWMIDEVAKYNGKYIEVNSFENIIDTIRTSGNWTNSGNGIFTRDFSGNDNFRLTTSSPMINTGITVSSRTADILGNELVGNPDIGPYEFQAPAATTSLSQYKSDGASSIPAGGWINETSVVLKFNMSSTNSPDSLTPYVEVKPNASPFTDSMTHSGTEVQYSDSPVSGSVTVSGLTDGVYHWQASAHNTASTGPWTTKGGNPDFGVDTSAPTGGSITYADGYNTSSSVALTVADGNDAHSGIDISTRTVQRRSATLSNGACSNYGEYSTIEMSGTYPNLTDTTIASGYCYQYQYLVSDNAGNQATYTGTNTVKVDSAAPIGGSIDYADGYNTSSSVALTVADGNDAHSGIDISTRTVQRRTATLANGACSNYGEYSTIAESGDYPNFTDTTIASGYCYQYQYLVSDNAGNQATYTGTNTVKVDSVAPTGGSIDYADGYNTSSSVALTVADGNDEHSGIDISTRTVQRRLTTLSNGICGSYGEYSIIAVSGDYPNYIDPTASSGYCYQYQYLVSDNAGNQTTYTGTNTVKVGISVPMGGSIDYANGYNTSSSVALTVYDGYDPYSGIDTSSRTVQRRSATLANGICDSYGEYSTIAVSGDYPDYTDTTISSGYCYQYQYLVSNNAGNQATYTGTNTVKVDTSIPSAPGIPSTTTPTTLLSQTWSWTAATNTTSGIVRYIWRVTGAASLTGTTTSTSVVTSLGEGVYTFFVKAESGAGFYGPESQGVLVVNKVTEKTTLISSIIQPTLPTKKSSSTSPIQDCTYELEAPTLYKAVAQSSTSILLYLSDKNSYTDKYILEYGTESGNYTNELVGVKIALGSPKTYLVESLSPNTTYYFRIRSDNECAEDVWSNEITATTTDSDSEKKLEITPTEKAIQGKSFFSPYVKYFVRGGLGLSILLLIISLAKRRKKEESNY